MNLDERLRATSVREGRTWLRVTMCDGSVFVGLFKEYTDAEDNEEGVASISIATNPEKPRQPEHCLFENEIVALEAVVPNG